MTEQNPKDNNVRSIKKAISILECFRVNRTRLTLTQISKEVKMPLSTASRFVSTLVDEGMLQKTEDSRGYLLGAKVYYLGIIARDSNDLRKTAFPFMEDLCGKFLETINLFIRVGNERFCYEQISSPQNLRGAVKFGESMPLWAGASGRCFLLTESLEERRKIFEEARFLTPNTILEFQEFNRKIEEIAVKGYGISHGEREEGITAISSPVYDASEKIVAVLAISMPSLRANEEKVAAMGMELARAASGVSRRLGYRISENTSSE